jgi:hypothetical protein
VKTWHESEREDRIYLVVLVVLLVGVALAATRCMRSHCEDRCNAFADQAEFAGGGRVCLCRGDDGVLYEPRSRERAK